MGIGLGMIQTRNRLSRTVKRSGFFPFQYSFFCDSNVSIFLELKCFYLKKDPDNVFEPFP